VAEAAGTTNYALSVSVGVARCDAGRACTLADLFEQADRAMYAEKETRRRGDR
jgi:GGDEF domain-containing protein